MWCGVYHSGDAQEQAAELWLLTAGASQEPSATPAAAAAQQQQQQPALPASPIPRQFYAKKIEDPGAVSMWLAQLSMWLALLSVLAAVSEASALKSPCSLIPAATSRLCLA